MVREKGNGHGLACRARAIAVTLALGAVVGMALGYRPWHSAARPECPLGVWDQAPEVDAQAYAKIGITQFVGLPNGPRPASLAALAAAHLRLVTGGQSPAVLADPNAGVISAWLLQDEPDNAQPAGGSYGPCISPAQIRREYRLLKAHDPGRPVVLGLGRGVADVNWPGRGSCSGHTGMYPQYARSADILSFDVYPVNDGLPIDIIANGVENLRSWGHGKPVWFDIETTSIMGTGGPSPAQTKAEIWLAIIHGASGITYFCDAFRPLFIKAGCLRDKAMRSMLKAQDARIQSLAPVLLASASVPGTVVRSSARIDTMTKRTSGATYVFAVEPGAATAEATFTVPDIKGATIEVLGENRTLRLRYAKFSDRFSGYGTHLYKIIPASAGLWPSRTHPSSAGKVSTDANRQPGRHG